jgi:hypothetical protein
MGWRTSISLPRFFRPSLIQERQPELPVTTAEAPVPANRPVPPRTGVTRSST